MPMLKRGDLLFNGEDLFIYEGETETNVYLKTLDGVDRAYGKFAYTWKQVPGDDEEKVRKALEALRAAKRKLDDLVGKLEPI